MRTNLIICLAMLSADSAMDALQAVFLPWLDWAFAAGFALLALSYFFRLDETDDDDVAETRD